MALSTNLSHWVCLLAGLFLILTAFLLRDIVDERPPAMIGPAGSRENRRRSGYGRRIILVGVGVAVAAYGISRIML